MGRPDADPCDASRCLAASVPQHRRVRRQTRLSSDDDQDEIVEEHEEPQAEGSVGANTVPGQSGGGYRRSAAPARTADEHRMGS
jgi:hypothetical protein